MERTITAQTEVDSFTAFLYKHSAFLSDGVQIYSIQRHPYCNREE